MEKGNIKKIVKKKRGRPPKSKRFQEEELKSNSLELDASAADNTNASSSSPAETNSTSLDEPTASKPRTKYALAVSDKKATPSSQSSITVQNVDECSSETLMLATQIQCEADRVDKANHAKVEAKDSHSDLEAQKGMTPPSNIRIQSPPRKNELDWGKSTSDITAQIPQPELPFQVTSPSNKTMTNHHPSEMEANAVSNSSPNLTVLTSENRAINQVMSEPEDPVIEVEGYKVKKEVAPLLKAIFKKYGDIARKSLFSMESRSCLLEMVCSIYKRLEASDIMQLTPLELDSMKGQIKDLELVRVNIGWLQERLNQISKVMVMDFKVRGDIDIVINEKKRAVMNCELKLQQLEVRLQLEKDELDELQICSGSLVHGLV